MITYFSYTLPYKVTLLYFARVRVGDVLFIPVCIFLLRLPALKKILFTWDPPHTAY